MFDIFVDPDPDENNYIVINDKIFLCIDCAISLNFNQIEEKLNEHDNIPGCFKRNFRRKNLYNIVTVSELLECYVRYIEYEPSYGSNVTWSTPYHVIFESKNSNYVLDIKNEPTETFRFTWSIYEINQEEKTNRHHYNVIEQDQPLFIELEPS